MKRFVHTKSFLFDKAQYILSDGNGNKLLLLVDYKKNNHSSVPIKENGGGYLELQKEARRVARDLLLRKSKTNFAKR